MELPKLEAVFEEKWGERIAELGQLLSAYLLGRDRIRNIKDSACVLHSGFGMPNANFDDDKFQCKSALKANSEILKY